MTEVVVTEIKIALIASGLILALHTLYTILRGPRT